MFLSLLIPVLAASGNRGFDVEKVTLLDFWTVDSGGSWKSRPGTDISVTFLGSYVG